MNSAKFIIQVSKGLIREHRIRRLTMFYALIFTLVMIFLGSTFLWPLLRESPLVFVTFWAICAWITLLVILLALYDLASVRAAARRERRRLEAEILAAQKARSSHDPHAR